MTDLPKIGVVIVTYAAEDVIVACLDSLLAQAGVALDIVVVDNASPDATVAEVQTVATSPPHRLRLIEAAANDWFAVGVNIGLGELQDASRIWILNPDCEVPAGTAAAFATYPEGFGLLGGRVIYADRGAIQIDGGRLNPRTGATRNINQGAPATTPPPDPAEMDFVTGASLVVSRAFLSQAGPMPEHYFLYYEEVAWAQARGPLPIAHCPEAVVHHAAGHSIGSERPDRPASALSLWFLHRNRQRFARTYEGAWLLPRLWTLGKAVQALTRGRVSDMLLLLRVAFGLPAPARVRKAVPPGVA